MAAISALMLNDNSVRRDSYEQEHASSMSRATGRGAPSLTGNTIRYTISNDGAQHARPEYGTAGAANTEIPGPQLHHSTSDAHSGGSMSDVMDVDRLRNDQDGSDLDDDDDDTEQGEAGSASKKKKGQRFFCTGYPPCNLSFTRSEHLARHIRKHTGERPFQCHCNRRFSRLDNLRQHAQTVHVNEEIPTDSLAATGTRFQRQIRTDRVRPSGRPRTSTMSSTGSHSHSRGHSRNLSASSVGSTSSNFSTSTVSTIDPRRRPPPLLMAGDGRPKLGLDAPSTPPPQFSSYSTHSPNDITTPTSATFSTMEGSPGFSTSIGSPLVSSQRGGFFGASRAPVRRLSVPSGPPPPQQTYMSPYTSPYPPNTGYSSAALSTNPSAMASPTSSTFSYGPGPGFSIPSSEEWRRRTWHPSTYSVNSNYNRPATSHLTYSQTPDAPRPTFAPNATAAAGHAPRLPGIESFDQVQQRPTTPPRNKQPLNSQSEKQSSLMPPVELDRQVPSQPMKPHPGAPKHVLEIGPQPGKERSENSWVQETIDQIHQIHAQAATRQGEVPRQSMGPPTITTAPSQPFANDSTTHQPNRNRVKRQGWYAGPLPASRTSPEDSSSSEGVPTPGTSNADVHPIIVHSNGVLEPQHAMIQIDGNQNACFPPSHNLPPPYTSPSNLSQSSHAHHRRSSGTELNRLDALVAVATSETNASR